MSTLRQLCPILALLYGGAGAVACPFNDADHCQPFDDSLNIAVSDRAGGVGILAADDFVPSGDTLSELCVWGFYWNGYIGGDCGAEVSPDSFRVRVFQNDPVTGRRPDVILAESTAISQRVALADSQVEAELGAEMYEFSLTLRTPIRNLVAGQVYWLEVSNEASLWGPPNCVWFWSVRNPTASSYFWHGDWYTGCEDGSPYPLDLAFCTNFVLGQSPVGTLPGACCTCDGMCTEGTLKECDDANGEWNINRTSCEGVICSTVPSNDNCADGPPVISEGEYVIPADCATTDGYGPIETDFGVSQIEGDVWFNFIAPPNCQLQIDTCQTYARCFDSILAVYHNPENPTVCPPCPLLSDPNGAQVSGATLAGMGQDESCLGEVIPDNGLWFDLYQLGRHALPGECFLIRVGNYPGIPREVEGILRVDCLDGPPPAKPLAEPAPVKKSRFLSFVVPPSGLEGGPETALRIKLTWLHHVSPPYTNGASNPFTLFEGQSMYVGPPAQYVESDSSQTPFLASKLQCAPHYRDWSTISILHVTGEAIVPSSLYQVENLAGSCAGHESTCTAVSAPLTITTTRWGDVAELFQDPNQAASQPDFNDIGAMVNKFKGLPGAPIKTRAKLAGVDARGGIDLMPDVGFDDISLAVDAFRGLPYPYQPGKCGGDEAKACATEADCTDSPNPTTGPCVLCP